MDRSNEYYFRSFGFSRIYIIESLGQETHTGRCLYDRLKPLADDSGIALEYIFVDSYIELDRALGHVEDEARNQGAGPILHLEMHGQAEGFQLTSGEVVPWETIAPRLAAINYCCKNNLLITCFVCKGANLFNVVPGFIRDRAPFWMLIASFQDISVASSGLAWGEFYSILIRRNDADAAFNALTRRMEHTGQEFKLLPAERVFRNLWRQYLDQYCSAALRQKRTEELMTRARQEWAGGAFPLKHLREFLKKSLRKENHESRFEFSRKHFFMADLYPENEQRIPVTLDEIMRSGDMG